MELMPLYFMVNYVVNISVPLFCRFGLCSMLPLSGWSILDSLLGFSLNLFPHIVQIYFFTWNAKLSIQFTLVYTIKYHEYKKTMFVKDETMVYGHFDEISISLLFHCFQWCFYVHSRPKIHSTLVDKTKGPSNMDILETSRTLGTTQQNEDKPKQTHNTEN
jgi:hypothetical protein